MSARRRTASYRPPPSWALIGAYRDGLDGPQSDSVAQQIRLYGERCEQMRQATTLGMISAILLLVALLCGGGSVLFPNAQRH